MYFKWQTKYKCISNSNDKIKPKLCNTHKCEELCAYYCCNITIASNILILSRDYFICCNIKLQNMWTQLNTYLAQTPPLEIKLSYINRVLGLKWTWRIIISKVSCNVKTLQKLKTIYSLIFLLVPEALHYIL